MKVDDKVKQITEGGEYVSWLDEFCEKNNSFNTYEQSGYTEEEKDYISNLRFLYFGIERKMREKYYYDSDFGGFYKIKFNGNGYFIGYYIATEVIFYCRKAIIDNEEDFVDFYNIESNEQLDNIEYSRKRKKH